MFTLAKVLAIEYDKEKFVLEVFEARNRYAKLILLRSSLSLSPFVSAANISGANLPLFFSFSVRVGQLLLSSFPLPISLSFFCIRPKTV
ncbi:hypothetical protein RIF29_17331 [Crotalaria pallida]|uniref:Uncharacterized protein n=1 Tax=Crotalaria pallida TaxID=3830 RepID=A0AAN9FKA7_CROPI